MLKKFSVDGDFGQLPPSFYLYISQYTRAFIYTSSQVEADNGREESIYCTSIVNVCMCSCADILQHKDDETFSLVV